jgi:hypothetical protein
VQETFPFEHDYSLVSTMSDAAYEANVQADGSATFDETPPAENDGGFAGGSDQTDELPLLEEAKFAIDPAIFLLVGVAIIIALYYFFVIKKKKRDDDDIFFAELDTQKVSVYSISCKHVM